MSLLRTHAYILLEYSSHRLPRHRMQPKFCLRLASQTRHQFCDGGALCYDLDYLSSTWKRYSLLQMIVSRNLNPT
ncbi:hypothetical protein BDR03DRAFT_580941 [Suillus americanus]|nr:hypothetical protein BDR03DRAFT_580941 [Suillus americanus]